MPNFTPNLNLEKPLQEEYYDIDIFNENSDKIDAFAGNVAFMRMDGGTYTQGTDFINPEDFLSHKRFSDDVTVVINESYTENINIKNVFLGRHTLNIEVSPKYLTTKILRFNNVFGQVILKATSSLGRDGLEITACDNVCFNNTVTQTNLKAVYSSVTFSGGAEVVHTIQNLSILRGSNVIFDGNCIVSVGEITVENAVLSINTPRATFDIRDSSGSSVTKGGVIFDAYTSGFEENEAPFINMDTLERKWGR